MIEAMTAAGFRRWLMNAKPGDTCVYFEGDLMSERQSGRIVEVADAAWAAYEDGRVLLTQRRLGTLDWRYEYEYLATARSA